MADDFTNNISTTGSVSVGGDSSGSIETSGDSDWFAVTLVAGTKYRIDLLGTDKSNGTLSDPNLLGVYNSAGNPETLDISDDLGMGLSDSQAYFTPPSSGTYYISAAASGNQTGTYKLSVASVTESGLTVAVDSSVVTNTIDRFGDELIDITANAAVVTNDGAHLGGTIVSVPYPATVVATGDSVSFTNSNTGTIDQFGLGENHSAAVLFRGEQGTFENNGLVRSSNQWEINSGGTDLNVDFGIGVAHQSAGTFAFVNGAGGAIHAGSSAVLARVFNYAGNDPEGNFVGGWTSLGTASVTNHGLLTSGDDTVRLEAGGTVTNSGTIISTGEWLMDLSQTILGRAADGVSIFQRDSTLSAPDPLTTFASVTNSGSGTIDGYRSGVVAFSGSGNIDNAGLIKGGDAGIVMSSYDGAVATPGNQWTATIINSGTITSDGSGSGEGYSGVVNYLVGQEVSSGNGIVTLLNFGDVDITNSGIISGVHHGIFALSGVTLTNANGATLTGDSDISGSGDAFRGATLADYLKTDIIGNPIPDGQGNPTYWSMTDANFDDVITNNGTIIGDVLLGDGDDTFNSSGGAFFGMIDGGNGSDTLTGGNEDETFHGGNGADTISGGPGSDTLSYSASGTAVTIRLWDGFASGGHADGDTFNGIENVEGSFGNDTIAGNAEDNELSGKAGDDTIDGGKGNDSIWGAVGQDDLFGGLGNDYLSGGSQNDNVDGGEGDDILDGGAGADLINGRDGTDAVSYASATGSITLHLWSGTGLAGDAQGDDLHSIENIIGSNYDDFIMGSFISNTIWLGNGNDTGNGGYNDDILYGEAGDDTIFADEGNDTIFGGIGDDGLHGRKGDDLIDGGSGADRVYGYLGNDTVTFENSNSGVDVSIVRGTGIGGDAQGDTYNNIENFIGSAHNDIIKGDAGINILSLGGGDDIAHGGFSADTIEGGSGNDTIYGDGGDDYINAGTGDDWMDGGDQNDTFIFINGDGIDAIWSFQAGAGTDDVIDFSNHSVFNSMTDVLNNAIDLNGHTVISDGAGGQITIYNVAVANLHADDFDFGASSIKKPDALNLLSLDLAAGGSDGPASTSTDWMNSDEEYVVGGDPLFNFDDDALF